MNNYKSSKRWIFVVEMSGVFGFGQKMLENRLEKVNFCCSEGGPDYSKMVGFNFWIKLNFFEAFAN